MKKTKILIPVYNDWESLKKLLKDNNLDYSNFKISEKKLSFSLDNFA